jgi:hypothetical protein
MEIRRGNLAGGVACLNLCRVLNRKNFLAWWQRKIVVVMQMNQDTQEWLFLLIELADTSCTIISWN